MRQAYVGLFVLAGLVSGTEAGAEPPPGHGFHPPMPGRQYLVRLRLERAGEAAVTEADVELGAPGSAAELKQVVEGRGGAPDVRLKRYLPQAELEQQAVADLDGTGAPAIELQIAGPTQSFRRWLAADDVERNRLVSFIGTWRYLAVQDGAARDALFQQFREELTRAPRLLVGRVGESKTREFGAEPGQTLTVEEPACRIRVATFYPHFALDESTRQPTNQSEKRLNPAVQVEIEMEGKKETRWVFAKFPDFKMGEGEALPVRLTLDCPAETPSATPDFVVVTVGRAAHEVWSRYEGVVESRAALLDQKVKVPPSQYTFQIAQFVPAARLVERYVPTEGRSGTPALEVETTDAKGQPVSLWLGLDQQRMVATKSGPMAISFAAKQPGAPGAGSGAHP